MFHLQFLKTCYVLQHQHTTAVLFGYADAVSFARCFSLVYLTVLCFDICYAVGPRGPGAHTVA